MKAYFSIIKYCPYSQREEFWNIGLIMINTEDNAQPRIKFSEERIKKINKIFDIKKTHLLDISIESIKTYNWDPSRLNKMSVVENGILRYSEPKILITENIDKKFDEFYNLYVDGNIRNEVAHRRGIVRKNFIDSLKSDSIIKEKLSIAYKIPDVDKFFLKDSKIDFIGGNGQIFCGNMPDLDADEETVEKNLNKTFMMFEVLSKKFENRFSPEECKLIINETQATEENAEIIEKLENWKREFGYDVIIEKDQRITEIIRRQIQKKNIIPFDLWIEKLKLNMS